MRTLISSAFTAVLLSWAVALSGTARTVTRHGGSGMSVGTLRAWARVPGRRKMILRPSLETRGADDSILQSRW